MVQVLNDANPIEISAAAAILPGRPSRKTVYRWTLKGCVADDGQRIVLESARIGGRRWTSREAIERFIAGMGRRNETAAAPAVDSSAVLRMKAAEARLAAEGI